MHPTTLLQLEEIRVLSFKYNCNLETKEKKKEIIEASDLDFDFTIQDNKESVKRKRILFSLKTTNKSMIVKFEITVLYQFSFFKDKNDQEISDSVQTVLIPQIISFLRGYLLASTEKGPFAILLPSVNVIESLKEKAESKENKSIKTIEKAPA